MRINRLTQENELDINNQEQNKGKLTHFNEAGEAHMVDVHAKDDTYRVAKACGTIRVNGAVYRAVSTGTAKRVMCWQWRELRESWAQRTIPCSFRSVMLLP